VETGKWAMTRNEIKNKEDKKEVRKTKTTKKLMEETMGTAQCANEL
jgi:hypothetical protein